MLLQDSLMTEVVLEHASHLAPAVWIAWLPNLLVILLNTQREEIGAFGD